MIYSQADLYFNEACLSYLHSVLGEILPLAPSFLEVSRKHLKQMFLKEEFYDFHVLNGVEDDDNVTFQKQAIVQGQKFKHGNTILK